MIRSKILVRTGNVLVERQVRHQCQAKDIDLVTRRDHYYYYYYYKRWF